MTAPTLALDALCGSPACHGHRCPRIRHGYVRGELRGKCSQHRHCRAFELDELASLDPAPTDSPAGADGLSPDRPRGALPGPNPAPTPVGVVAASPPEGGQPAAEVDPPASAAGQLLHQGRTWWCPRCLNARELPTSRCCRVPLIDAETIVRRRIDV